MLIKMYKLKFSVIKNRFVTNIALDNIEYAL